MAEPPLVLAGLGHAHLFVLEALARGALRGVDAVLVTPGRYAYSGMISGVVAGQYRPEEAAFCADRLARAAGAHRLDARVQAVDAGRRRLTLDDGTSLPYRLLSLDIGSGLAGTDTPGVREHALPVKPVGELPARLARAEAAGATRVVVVGGGAAGVELALCTHTALAARPATRGATLTLVERGGELLAEYPPRARRLVLRLLRERGVEVRLEAAVERVEAGMVRVRGAGDLPCDLLLWATGPSAPALFRASGLPSDADGYLRVEPTLRADGHPEIFAAGDCVALAGAPWVARAGVYAVREGPVLADNLARALRGVPLRPYRPQRRWLSLLNTGDGRALLHYRGIVLHDRACWRLKDAIDRRFVRRFQRLEAGPPDGNRFPAGG